MKTAQLYPWALWLGLVWPAAPGSAGPNANARLFLHLTSPTQKACEKGGVPQTPCAGTRTNGALYPETWYAHLLVCQGNAAVGVGGMQCGIAYDAAPASGVDIIAWTLCASLEFPSNGWPASGGGNRIAWEPARRCQRSQPWGGGAGVVALAGYFYGAAYTDDLLRVGPRPEDGRAEVIDCEGRADVLSLTPSGCSFGAVRFSADGRAEGVNPCCCAVPVRETSWSGLKRLYGRSRRERE